jgi:hypothetical protein
MTFWRERAHRCVVVCMTDEAIRRSESAGGRFRQDLTWAAYFLWCSVKLPWSWGKVKPVASEARCQVSGLRYQESKFFSADGRGFARMNSWQSQKLEPQRARRARRKSGSSAKLNGGELHARSLGPRLRRPHLKQGVFLKSAGLRDDQKTSKRGLAM